MKKFLLVLLILLLFIVGVLVFNTLTFKSKQISPGIGPKEEQKTDSAAVKHLSDAIKFSSISYDDSLQMQRSTVIDSYVLFLQKSYPLVFNSLQDTLLNGRNILLKWEGSNSNLPPAILYAHMDVVPIEENTRNQWKHEPFSGDVAEGYIWGRGAIDDKGSQVAILESINRLLTIGFKPERTLYFAFGSDEEIGGNHGAAVIAQYCRDNHVHFAFYLDEGGMVAQDIVPGISKDVALIGTSEKGYTTFELTVNMQGGHSSRPPATTALDVMASAIEKIHNHPFKKHSCLSIDDFVEYVGPEMGMPLKLIFANKWLFKSLILSNYAKTENGNAMVRTTGVTTVLNAGLKENVIPSKVSAKVNFRILPGETAKEVELQLKEILHDPRVEVAAGEVYEPSATSSTDAWGFKLLQKTSSGVFPDAIVTPFLMIGSTDSKHFDDIADNIYRFFPTRLDNEELKGFHGINERIKISGFMETIAFYTQLLKDMQTFKPETQK